MQNVSRLINTFRPNHYDLVIDVQREARTFSGTVAITGEKVSDEPIRLHAKDISITAAQINGVSVENIIPEQNDETVLNSDTPAGNVTITLEFNGAITDGMHGMYPCYYQVDGEKKELIATQFESHHAREVFPCIDEPEAKATFDLALTTETGVEVLSNMPVTEQKELDNEKRETRFQTTSRMSTYLLVWVVGDLHKKTATTKSGVEVNAWATKAHSLDMLDFPLDVAMRSIDFFDDYFGVPYPLPKADHVALPDFSSGAMENWGLITYREVCLLADDSTAQSSREWIATVIAHETSHQWFGNLVTMRWWDDLWLNESFATVMEYIATDALFPQWNMWNNFASAETLSALRRDQLAGVQAVKVDVNHPDEISTLFDPSIVYAKGARLLKMLRSYVGEDAWRSGLANYFKQHQYSSTTGDDLWDALSKTSGKDVKTFMDRWLTQSGLPLVSVTTTGSGYRLEQRRFVVGEAADDRRWDIPLNAHNTSFPEVLSRSFVEFDAPHTLPLLNHDNTAHFVSTYDDDAMKLVYEALQNGGLNVQDRLALLHETSLLTRSGDVSTANIITLVDRFSSEQEEPVWSIIAMIIGDLKRFVDDDDDAERNLKQFVQKLCLPLYNKLGLEKAPDESEQDTKLRALIVGLLCYGEHQPVLDWAVKQFASTEDLGSLEAETRGVVFTAVARHGSPDDFARLLRAHDEATNPELRDDIASSVTATRSEAQITQLIARLQNSELTKPQDITRWYINLLRNRYAREQTWQWMQDNWSWIEKTFAGDKSYDDFARYSANILNTHEWLERYIAFFEPLSTQPALKRAYDIGLIDIRTRAEWLERDRKAVRAALSQ